MKEYSHFMHSVASDHALEILANSMWSTMMITGLFFMSFMFLFLSVKVGHSVGIESVETGPVEFSFLFSFSGIRYIGNHARHHLFETPLLPRRRYSSLSVSWISEFIKRASFSSRSGDIFSEEDSTHIPDKSRRNSASTDSHASRRSSITSKSKRLSVPHITSIRNNNPVSIHSIPQTLPDKNDAPPKVKFRRNTLPNISLTSKSTIGDKSEAQNLILVQKDNINLLDTRSVSSNLNTIIEEEPTDDYESSNLKPNDIDTNSPTVSSNDHQEDINRMSDLEECESIFGDIITDDSDVNSILEEKEEGEGEVEKENINYDETEAKEIKISSNPINIVQNLFNQPPVDKCLEQSSPKPTSFRSTYLNYLPESIFGYSIGLSKNYSPTTKHPTPINPVSAPPGFTKRSTSHDFNGTNTTDYSGPFNDNFSSHQPLYARRRTETFCTVSDVSKSSLHPIDLKSKFQSISGSFSEASTGSPNRTNTSSPCLIDLQNTEDLFAPINWNFSSSDQSDSLRKSWDSIAEEESVKSFPGSSYEDEVKKSDSNRRQSTSFSSLFDAY